MSPRGDRSRTVWRFPAAGFAAVSAAAALPGSPWGPGRWPARGPFGAFTWASWFVTAGMAATLLLLAAALALSAGRGRGRAQAGRAVPAALTFALLAASAYLAAARVDEIRRSPAAALLVALIGLAALRAVAARLRPAPGDPGADVAG